MLLPIQISLFVTEGKREAILLVTYAVWRRSLGEARGESVNSTGYPEFAANQSAQKNTFQCFSILPLQRTPEENHRGMTLTSTNYEHCAKAVV